MADSSSSATDSRLVISQAIFDSTRCLANCPNFREDWIPEALRLVNQWGTLPAGCECPEALFAYPFAEEYNAVVTVAGPPTFSNVRFRFLILSRALYEYIHNPFQVAEQYVPHWYSGSSLPPLEWDLDLIPPRTVAELDAVLKRGYGPLLLGGTQVLVDAGKLALQRSAPEPKLVQDIWMLLPDAVRRIVRPATFACSMELDFDLVILPSLPDPLPPGYLKEDQAAEYPPSRYEISLQVAVESGDQREVSRLLARRTTKQMIRFMLWILLGMALLAIAAKVLMP